MHLASAVLPLPLGADDAVVALAIVDPSAQLLVAGTNGIGKRTPFDAYRLQSRGGKGGIQATQRRGSGQHHGASVSVGPWGPLRTGATKRELCDKPEPASVRS